MKKLTDFYLNLLKQLITDEYNVHYFQVPLKNVFSQIRNIHGVCTRK